MPTMANDRTHIQRLRGFDLFGGILSVSWPIPLLFGLQEGGARYAWNSGPIIGTLVGGIILLLVFGAYEGWLTCRSKIEPVFPIQFLRDLKTCLLLL
jgi:hypothetical protein